MSADNWTTCPKCAAAAVAEASKRRERAAKQYGKVSAEEYERLRKEAENVPQPDNDTLREDYEIGVRGSVFHVDFGCSCSACGFHYEFKTEEALK